MSQKKDKNMRKVAKDMAAKLIPEMANNTMEVMQQMQETWPMEEKVQWCRWFLGLENLEDLIPELAFEDENQLELPLEEVQHGTDS
jgi:hypothetical protein